MGDIRRASGMTDEELYVFAKELQAPYHLLKEVARTQKTASCQFCSTVFPIHPTLTFYLINS